MSFGIGFRELLELISEQRDVCRFLGRGMVASNR